MEEPLDDAVNPLEMAKLLKTYQSAIREMRVRFEILNDELEFKRNRNPIHHVESRLKKPSGIVDKIKRYGKPQTMSSIRENILDIAGVRVICSYTDDVYAIFEALQGQDDLEIVTVKDYIANPKPNGYRSLHLIVRVPIYFMDEKEYVPVEIQFRTIAMDLWASLEHDLKYKSLTQLENVNVAEELRYCANLISDAEYRLQILNRALEAFYKESRAENGQGE